MSDYHVLEKSGIEEQGARNAAVYVHLDIPSSQNVAGNALGDATLTYQKAMKQQKEKESETGTIESEVPDITSSELTALQNGEKIEMYVNFRFSSLELTNAERRSEIENGNDNMDGVIQMKADIADSNSDLYKETISPLDWWGYHRDV